MDSQRSARPGTAGLLVVMATSGALLAFGQREGDPTRAFRNAGRMLLQSRPVAPDYLPLVATAVGMVHHILVAFLWGAILVLIARRFQGWAFAAAALGVSVTFVLLNLWVVPPILGLGYSVVTTLGRAVPFALAMTVALLVTPWASGVREQPPASTPQG